MLKEMTRSRLITFWFAAVALVAAAAVAIGVDMTFGTGVLLVALSLVPPVIVLFLWPSAQPTTVGDVLRGVDRRA